MVGTLAHPAILEDPPASAENVVNLLGHISFIAVLCLTKWIKALASRARNPQFMEHCEVSEKVILIAGISSQAMRTDSYHDPHSEANKLVLEFSARTHSNSPPDE